VEQQQAEFAEFYRSARDDCLRIVLVNVGDQTLAEDLVAEGFSRAWVVRAALNLNVSWWRRRRREVGLDGHDLVAPADPGTGLNRPMTTALRRLPARQREVITLRVLLDLDTETTARVLGISPGTVRAHLHRGLAAMRSEFRPPGGGARDRGPVPDPEPVGHGVQRRWAAR
jgi:RNA polymerase sigma-70 factor (ECF subfamily)